MRKERTLQNLMLFTFIVFNLYYGYRYLFRYNSTMTSPTYSDTPVFFQAMKYVIALLIIAVFIFILITRVEKIKLGVVEAILFVGAVFCLFKSIQFHDLDFFIRNYTFLFCAYIIMYVQDDNFELRLIKVNKFLFLYHVIYSLIQIIAYISVGRLPALAYANSLVRFGGGWDDPNAFGLYLLIPACYSLNQFVCAQSRKKRIQYLLLFFLSAGLELLTFSFTGYMLFVIAMVFMFVKYRKEYRFFMLSMFAVILVLIGLVIFYEKILNLFEVKSGSLAIHFSMLKLNFSDSFIEILIGGDENIFFENMYNIMLKNYGLVYFIISVGLQIYFIYIAYKVQKKYKENFNYYLGLIFLVCVMVGKAALPFLLILPINLIYWMFAFLFLRKYREIRTQRKYFIKRSKFIVE